MTLATQSASLLLDRDPSRVGAAAVETVRAVHRGQARLHPDLARKLMQQVAQQTSPVRETTTGNELAEREQEVVHLVARGCSNSEIAPLLVVSDGIQGRLHWYFGLILAYLVLFAAALGRADLPPRLSHAYLIVQSVLILGLLSLEPDIDHVSAFFLPLSYQVPFFFGGRTGWIWVGGLTMLVGGPLMFYHGLLGGLALGLTTIAAAIVIPAFVVVNQEIEIARDKSESMLKALQATRARLEASADRWRSSRQSRSAPGWRASCTTRSRRPFLASPSTPGRRKSFWTGIPRRSSRSSSNCKR